MTRIQIGGTIVEHRQRPPIRADVGCGDLAAVTAIDRVALQVFGVGLWDTGKRADHTCRLYGAITWSQWQAQPIGGYTFFAVPPNTAHFCIHPNFLVVTCVIRAAIRDSP